MGDDTPGWYEYEIFIALCTDNIYGLEYERWLLEDMIDHVWIYGSRVAEGLSAFDVGLVLKWTREPPRFAITTGSRTITLQYKDCSQVQQCFINTERVY